MSHGVICFETELRCDRYFSRLSLGVISPKFSPQIILSLSVIYGTIQISNQINQKQKTFNQNYFKERVVWKKYPQTFLTQETLEKNKQKVYRWELEAIRVWTLLYLWENLPTLL